jgi:hypothetical protein
MCEVLAVSISGYRAWRGGGKPDRTRLTDPQAVVLMKSIHAEFKGAYGSRRMHRELQDRSHRIGLRRVERLMREHGIRARHKRRYKATTDSKHSLPVAPNLLARNFKPEAPNRVWTGDITYIQTGEGWLYRRASSTAEERAGTRHDLRNASRRTGRSLRVHRGVLQPQSPPLHAGLPLAASVPPELDQRAGRSASQGGMKLGPLEGEIRRAPQSS